MKEWHKKRTKLGILMRFIYNNTKTAKERVKLLSKSKYTKFRFMPIELESPTSTLIFQNKVVLQQWSKEPFSVVIENETLTENYRRYFEELWKIAKS